MTLRGLPLALSCWRPALPTDLAAIARLADAIHPDYEERPAVFADRLALHPSGMMLAALDGEAVGYAVAHPWRGAAPLLDHTLGRLPDRPDSYWVHDVALLPPVRGCGLGRAALLLLRADAARCGLRTTRLAAVGGAGAFWRKAGFLPTDEALPPCYGTGAVAMHRNG